MSPGIVPNSVPEPFQSRRKRHLLFWDVDERGRPCVISLNPSGMSDEEYLARAHASADELEDEDHCYFVGGDDGPVKIGHAKNLKKRLMALQNGSPVKLAILAFTSGGLTRETAYHFQFAAYRLHGEWFERVPEIEEEIDRLSAKLLSIGGELCVDPALVNGANLRCRRPSGFDPA